MIVENNHEDQLNPIENISEVSQVKQIEKCDVTPIEDTSTINSGDNHINDIGNYFKTKKYNSGLMK